MTIKIFSAPWCTPCKILKQWVESQGSKEFPLHQFEIMNVEEDEVEAGMYNVKTVPTVVFIQDGQQINQMVGADIPRLKSILANS